MGSSPIPLSLQSKLQKSKAYSRLKDYKSNINMLVVRLHMLRYGSVAC